MHLAVRSAVVKMHRSDSAYGGADADNIDDTSSTVTPLTSSPSHVTTHLPEQLYPDMSSSGSSSSRGAGPSSSNRSLDSGSSMQNFQITPPAPFTPAFSFYSTSSSPKSGPSYDYDRAAGSSGHSGTSGSAYHPHQMASSATKLLSCALY